MTGIIMLLNQFSCEHVIIDKYNKVSVIKDTFKKYLSKYLIIIKKKM